MCPASGVGTEVIVLAQGRVKLFLHSWALGLTAVAACWSRWRPCVRSFFGGACSDSGLVRCCFRALMTILIEFGDITNWPSLSLRSSRIAARILASSNPKRMKPSSSRGGVIETGVSTQQSGGGASPVLAPQSVQSLPKSQRANSAPGPPSSHIPSELSEHVSAQRACARAHSSSKAKNNVWRMQAV